MIKTIQFLSKERIVAFSDGVIAIIITLMILDIHFPKTLSDSNSIETWSQLSGMLPQIIAYSVSFYGLGIFWINHHNFFHMIKHSDRNFLWLNLNLLFWLSLIPLPTSYLAEHYDSPIATTLYGTVMLLSHASFGLLVLYASKKNLTLDNYNQASIRRILRTIVISCILWLTAIAVGYLSTYISYIIILMIAVAYFLPQNLELHHDTKENE